MEENHKKKIKDNIFNFIGYLVIFLFLAIGIILFLVASHVFGSIGRGGTIASYIFGSISLILFILIIIKIFLIIASENKYAKNAIDVNKIFEGVELDEEEKNTHNLFLEEYHKEISSLNIYFGAFVLIEQKHYKKDIDINHPKVRMLIEQMIIDGIKKYGFFDLYLVIEFSKTINKKFIWKGDHKKYKIYFEYIRKIYHIADDYIYNKYFIK
ncbi:hypothetical protein ACT1UH_03255 [Mycoplasma sp. 332]|uniref:hypothetical protein n=1 Tax=unclassified Asterococcus (in: mycoplasmas, genus) TaxID=3407551 RepID=UPI003F657BFE